MCQCLKEILSRRPDSVECFQLWWFRCVCSVQIVAHFTGFWISAGILLAYVVLMPILGLILACCRCCGNCGGRMYQEKTNSLHCERRTFYWVVLITSVFILWVEINGDRRVKCFPSTTTAVKQHFSLFVSVSVCSSAGNVYMFINNQAFKDGLDQTPTELNSTLTNVLRFTEALPEVKEPSCLVTCLWFGPGAVKGLKIQM